MEILFSPPISLKAGTVLFLLCSWSFSVTYNPPPLTADQGSPQSSVPVRLSVTDVF